HARIREDGAGGHQDQQRESILLDRRTATSRQAIPRATPRLDIGGIAISHSVEVDERHPAVWPNDDVAGGDIPMHHAADAQGIPDIGKGPEELYQAVPVLPGTGPRDPYSQRFAGDPIVQESNLDARHVLDIEDRDLGREKPGD